MQYFLMRHGDTNCKKQKVFQSDTSPLSYSGVTKVHDTYEKVISSIKISAIRTSPLTRAIQTASIINEGARVPLIIDPSLAEIHNPPSIRGKPYHSRKADSLYRHWLSRLNENNSLESIYEENYFDLHSRVQRILEGLRKSKEENTLIVSHSVTIRSIIASILSEGKFSTQYLDIIQNTKIDNCEIVEIAYVEGKWLVNLGINHTQNST